MEENQVEVQVQVVGVGSFAKALILANKNATNKQILDRIKTKFPDAKTSMACVAWYKSDLRKKGLLEKKTAAVIEVSEEDLVI